ncbi:MAG: phasin family protein [Sphingomonas sp.]|uniref:phasin family protein n=1 Tax=Sphingomonas sp. TaxID=28214 RepID=UPI001209D35C|nr:phasin family protein [Sphingomonas sp.]THD34530.1 MAG: phasin family protein [Sphingomonas sp.]
MSTKAPVSKTSARKPVAKKPAVAKAASSVVAAPAAEQPVWPVVETPAVDKTVTAVTDKISAVAAEAAPATTKEVTKMEATIKDATAKGEALFADMNTRAKAAMEKGTKAFAELNEFNKGNVEALVESGKIAAKGFETLGQGYAEYARRQFEGTTAAFKSFAGVKSPTEFLKLHADFVRGQFDSMVAETSKNTEAFIKLAGDVAKPISNRVAVAAEKLKVAA